MLARSLGVKVQLEQIIGANRIPFLLTNKIDLVISAMGATPERAVQVMFTNTVRGAVYRRLWPQKRRGDRTGQPRITQDCRNERHDAGPHADPACTERQHCPLRGRYDVNTAYLSGQTDLWATLNTIAIDLSRRNPQRETELKFKLRNSPAHMAVRQVTSNCCTGWTLTSFSSKGSGELDRLHRTWLGEGMGDIPVL